MPTSCTISGCKAGVPPTLETERYCLLHFTLHLEEVCGQMRRETALGTANHSRQQEIIQYISGNGEILARVATSGVHLADEMKARVLSTFLTLINLRENLDRAALRQGPRRTAAPSP